MHVHYARPVAGLAAIQSQTFHDLFDVYEDTLVQSGYHGVVARLHLQSIAHFGLWLEREGRRLELSNEENPHGV